MSIITWFENNWVAGFARLHVGFRQSIVRRCCRTMFERQPCVAVCGCVWLCTSPAYAYESSHYWLITFNPFTPFINILRCLFADESVCAVRVWAACRRRRRWWRHWCERERACFVTKKKRNSTRIQSFYRNHPPRRRQPPLPFTHRTNKQPATIDSAQANT